MGVGVGEGVVFFFFGGDVLGWFGWGLEMFGVPSVGLAEFWGTSFFLLFFEVGGGVE